MQNNPYLAAYYATHDEDSRLLSRHGHVEYATTMRYIDRYLRPGMRVLEIGAGTGRYSHALARAGYRVDAVELMEHNIAIFNQHTQPGEQVTVRQGNALDLSMFADNTFDITLLLGPMYHLYTDDEQRRALSEAVRVTKPGGVIYTAYCMADPTVLVYGFIRGNIKQLIADDLVDTETFSTRSRPCDLFELYRVEDIAKLRAALPVQQLHLVAADGYANHMRDALAAMDDETYQLYLQYHFATCERSDLIGYSNHTLDIFRKEEGGTRHVTP